MQSKRTVLLVGATGMLGSSILEALLAKGGFNVRTLLRPGKPEVVSKLQARGVETFEGDAMQPATLPGAMQGVDVVVSALHNDPRIFVPGHENLIAAAEAAGVERFVPSGFSVDYFKIEEDENFNLAMRKQVVPLFEGKRMRPIHVLNGAFLDTMLDPRAPFLDWTDRVLPYFGDGEQACDFTSVADTGRYVAEVCADAEAAEVVRVAGEALTMPGFAAALSRAFDKPIEARRQGSLEDLTRLIESKKKTATNPFEWIALQYHHNMVSGRAKLDPLDNGRYPNVEPASVEEFARMAGEDGAEGLGRS